MRKALKKARKQKGLKVSDIAKMLNVTESFYYKVEKGIRNPNMDKAKEIADIVGGTVDELFFSNELDETSNGSPPAEAV